MNKKGKSSSPFAQLGFQPLKDRVYKAIKQKITNIEYGPGVQLVEKQLAEELGVSKSPIRDAFRRLEQEGLVYSIPFRGCYVSDMTRKEFKEVFQLREALEIFSLEQALQTYSVNDIRGLRLATEAAKTELEKGKQNRAFNRHLNVHKLIVEKLGNELISNIYSNIIENKLKRYLNMGLALEDRVRLSSKEHETLLKAIEKKDVEVAKAELRNHLSSVLEEYLKKLF